MSARWHPQNFMLMCICITCNLLTTVGHAEIAEYTVHFFLYCAHHSTRALLFPDEEIRMLVEPAIVKSPNRVLTQCSCSIYEPHLHIVTIEWTLLPRHRCRSRNFDHKLSVAKERLSKVRSYFWNCTTKKEPCGEWRVTHEYTWVLLGLLSFW